MDTVITSIEGLPCSPFTDTCDVGIIITSGAPTYFKITGSNLSGITRFDWYPRNHDSVLFKTRQLILVNECLATCMVMVTNNFHSLTNRGGHLSFRLEDGTVLTYPVRTFGQLGQLWTSPYQGINTG